MRLKIPTFLYVFLIACCLLFLGWYAGLLTADYVRH